MIIEGWLKRSKKSAGNLTFSKWKSKTTGRQKSPGPPPESVSQRVLDQRTQMGKIKQIYNVTVNAIQKGFKEYTGEMSVWAAFTKYNITPASNFSVPGAPVTVYEDLTFGKGAILESSFTATADQSSGFITVDWSAVATGNQDDTDMPQIVIWNNTQEKWLPLFLQYEPPGTTRVTGGSGNLVIPTGDIIADDEVYIWLFFEGQTGGPNEGKVSTSHFEQITVTA